MRKTIVLLGLAAALSPRVAFSTAANWSDPGSQPITSTFMGVPMVANSSFASVQSLSAAAEKASAAAAATKGGTGSQNFLAAFFVPSSIAAQFVADLAYFSSVINYTHCGTPVLEAFGGLVMLMQSETTLKGSQIIKALSTKPDGTQAEMALILAPDKEYSPLDFYAAAAKEFNGYVQAQAKANPDKIKNPDAITLKMGNFLKVTGAALKINETL